MNSLEHKIDFAVILTVDHANPNGDPLNGNKPRIAYDNRGEISDVCLKRKMRDRLMEAGYEIFVQSDDRKKDNMTSLQNRAFSEEFGLGKDAFTFKKSKKGETIDQAEIAKQEETAQRACAKWFDVRAFGQLFAFSAPKNASKSTKEPEATTGEGGKDNSGSGVSIAIRGPVTVRTAFSVEPVDIASVQITKSVSGEGDGSKRASDTMGMKHRVDAGVYYFFGSMNPQLAERTGFSDQDAEVIKSILPRLFENDASSARPEGSMRVNKVLWWQQDSKAGKHSSAKVHGSLKVYNDASYELNDTAIPGLKPEVIEGF